MSTTSASCRIGDYVLATKYADGDPGDQWCVGWLTGTTAHDPPRYDVVDNDGQLFRGNGFRRAERITLWIGKELLRRNADERWELMSSIRSLWDVRDALLAADPDPSSTAKWISGNVYWAETLPYDSSTLAIQMKCTQGLVQTRLVAQTELDALILKKQQVVEHAFEEFVKECIRKTQEQPAR